MRLSFFSVALKSVINPTETTEISFTSDLNWTPLYKGTFITFLTPGDPLVIYDEHEK